MRMRTEWYSRDEKKDVEREKRTRDDNVEKTRRKVRRGKDFLLLGIITSDLLPLNVLIACVCVCVSAHCNDLNMNVVKVSENIERLTSTS